MGEFKIDFQDGGRIGFLMGMILAIFSLQVTTIPLSEFRVNWAFVSREALQNRFSR